MNVVMIGTGYVGLVSGACLAEIGHHVTCVDSDHDKIAGLQEGRLPIFEPGLEDVVERATAAGTLAFSTDLQASVRKADAIFIAVGTPARPCDGHADLTHVFSAVSEMAPALPPRTVVVVKSTVPVGTGDDVERLIRSLRPTATVAVVSNPEFLRAGSAVQDFLKPDRVVIGAEDDIARERIAKLYRPLLGGAVRFVFTSRRSSELIKYTANAMLAARLALVNEIADLCEEVGADIHEVVRGVSLDPRIGPQFLAPGPGYGGSCFRKDARALAKMGEDHMAPMYVVEAAVTSNERRKRGLIRKIARAVGGPLRGRRIALLGLTFKANTDDMRESPSIPLVSALIDAGATVVAYDPAGMEAAQAVLHPDVSYADSAYEAAAEADAAVVLTGWNEFRNLDLARLRDTMAAPVIVDMRSVFRTADLDTLGFRYYCIGRPARPAPRAPAPRRGASEDRVNALRSRTAPTPMVVTQG